MIRILVRAFLFLIGLAAIVIVGVFSYWSWRQHQTAIAMAIDSPNGIEEASYVRLNGMDQWVTIRGEDRSNPVLLMLAGGPGDTLWPESILFRPWEKYFTVVQWDQPGVLRTYERNGEAGEGIMTAARFAADGIALAEYLRAHLNKKKIVLLGDSFGTNLGVRMIKARPDLFSAYVGTGQVVASELQEEYNYDALLKKARAAHDMASVRALEGIHRPPYKTLAGLLVERRVSVPYTPASDHALHAKLPRLFLYAPDTTLRDICTDRDHGNFAGPRMFNELIRYDARAFGTDFDVPIFVFEGDQDVTTPPALSRPWLESLHAPAKAFVSFPGAGHSLLLSEPDAFLKELVARVRPTAIRN